MPIDLNDTGLESSVSFGNVSGGVIDDPPFHILALGNWSGDAERRGFSARRPVEIDRDNFDEVIARLNTSVVLDFDDGSELKLEFTSLDDFNPDEIFRRVDMFEQLRSIRKRLNSSETFNSAAYEAKQLFGLKREDIEPTVASADDEPAADNLLDAILLKPEGGAAAPKRKLSGELGSLISELVRPHIVTVDEQQQSNLVSLVDAATSGLMRKILHHRKFQALEAAWRGLFFLVRRTDTSTELKIWVLDVSKDEFAADLKNAESLSSTHLFKVLVSETVETQDAEPWSIVLGDYAFAPIVDDVATLMRISKIAAAAGAPFVSHMRPDVLGVHSLYENSDPAKWNTAADSDAAKLWAALIGQAESQYLGMTIPRFITRLPYGSDTEPLDTFSFEEFEAASEHDNYLWSNGCFAVGQLLAESFAKYGWEMSDRLAQDIEGLPLHVYKQDGETVYKPCAEIPMTDLSVNQLIAAGLMPLVSYRGTDRIKLAMFQSIAKGGDKLPGRWV
ncbi:MAG: type VI secretion system contractile sheath large subunit [bacterium]|nr:type VI secretion system contractile sheath large subunit [bacterium]